MNKKKKNKLFLVVSIILVVLSTIGLALKLALFAVMFGWFKKTNVKELIP